MRMAKRWVRALVITATLLVGASTAAVIATQTAWFKNWLRAYVVKQANRNLNGQLSIGRLGGTLFRGVELENVVLAIDGREAVSIGSVVVQYNVMQLITKGISIDHVRLDQPVVHLWRSGGSWAIARAVRKESREADRSGPGRPIAIQEIDIAGGSVVIHDRASAGPTQLPSRIERLDASVRFRYEPVRYSVEIAHVSFRGSDPAFALLSLSGGVAVRDDTLYVNRISVATAQSALTLDGAVEHYLTAPVFRVKAASDRMSIPEIARLVPALAGRPVTPAFQIALDGPLNRLNVTLNLRSSAGDVSGRVVADLDGPQQSVTGDVDVRRLDLAPLLPSRPQKTDISVKAHADLRGASLRQLDRLQGMITFTAPHVAVVGLAADSIAGSVRLAGTAMTIDTRFAMYEASVTAAGRLVLPRKSSPFTYDLRGRVRGLDLRALPTVLKTPPAPTRLNVDYHAAGRGGDSVDVRADLLDSTVAGAQISAPGTASFALNGGKISYAADATIAGVDLQRMGHAFNVRALDTSRFTSALQGHVMVTGSGAGAADLDLAANGVLTDSSLGPGRIDRLMFDARFAEDTLHVKASGGFADLDPGALSGKAGVAGKVTGALDVDATVAGISSGVAADNVQADGRVTIGASTVGRLSIDRAAIDGTYRDASGQVRQLEIHGPDVNVEAHGTLALDDAGQSDLRVHADAPGLDRVAMLFNRQAAGIAAVDATITGNGRALHAAGRLTGNDLEFNGQSALQLASDFTLQMPDLDAKRARGSATTKATFAVLGRQQINELTATTEYGDRNLEFDVAAKQPQRSVNAAGSLALDLDQNRVRLSRLALQTQNVQWQTEPDARAEIRFGGGAVSVKNLRLISGNQELSAGGTFGQPEDGLTVEARNIELATVDALMLRPPMLTGTLNASAEISGTGEAPRVNGRFDVRQGAFRQARFDSFAGSVDYAGRGMTIEARLQQSPANWLEAKGYVPVAAFRKTGSPDESGSHSPAPSKEDAFDLHINSTPVDLGLVQGVTTALTGVKGTTQVNVDITGAANDPHPSGTIMIENAAFTVAPTGVTYTDLDGRIELEPDRIHIVDIEVLDGDSQPLSVTGDLAIHERQLGGVNVYVNASDFKILKNNLGDLRIDSDVRITGDLLRPRIEGDLGVTSGVVNLDPLIESVAGSAAATAPTAYTTRGGGPRRSNLADSAGVNGRGAADPALSERINAPEGSADRLDAGVAARAAAVVPQPAPAGDGERQGARGFSAVSMDVHLAIANDFVVRSNDLALPDAPIGLGAVNVTIGGDLRLVKMRGRDVVRLVGTVNTVRGTYDFQGRRFSILRDGTIRFEGGRDINPDLSVTAERPIQGVLASVNVRGTLKKPELVLSSVPPLERSEILSLIVFNQPINQIGEGQQVALAQRAQQLAAGALASTLTNSLGKALNLTEFSIQAGTDSGSAAQVTAGQQLNENLYAKIEQGFGDVSTTNFILEYEIARWLRLRTNWLQGTSAQPLLFQRTQDSGIDLLFTFHH